MLLRSLLSTQAVGYATSDNYFDDLNEGERENSTFQPSSWILHKSVGLWPSLQNIDKVTELNVWCTPGRVNAIEVKYKLVNDEEPIVRLHGRREGIKAGCSVGGVCFDAFPVSQAHLV